MSTLDQRIGTALASDTVKSADIAALVAEVEQALADAVKNAAKVREAALDPIESPDVRKAQASVEMAQFGIERLRAVLPRLEAKLAEAQSAESYARWQADFDRVEALRDAAAERFRETRQLIERLAELFHDAGRTYLQISERINETFLAQHSLQD